MPRELIRGWEEESFKRLRPRREVTNQRGVSHGEKKIARGHEFPGCQFTGDIEHRLTFAHRERLLVNVSFGKFPENIHAGRSVVEEIFSRLQRPLRIPARINLERRRASDHAIFLQYVVRIPARSSVRYIRSEERRVGKKWRSRCAQEDQK